MKIFNRLDNYINEYEYKIIIMNNSIDIVNYIRIVEFTTDVIKIEGPNGITTIKGNNLVIAKMLSDEVLIVGKFSSIEL